MATCRASLLFTSAPIRENKPRAGPLKTSSAELKHDLYTTLYDDYEQRNTLEARLVKAADVLDLLVQLLALERAGARGLDEFWEVAEKPTFKLGDVADQTINEVFEALLKARSEIA